MAVLQPISVPSDLQDIVSASQTIGVRYDVPAGYISCFAGIRGSGSISLASVRSVRSPMPEGYSGCFVDNRLTKIENKL